MPGFNSSVNADLGPYMMAGTDPFNLTPTRQCFGTSKSLINHYFLKRS
jgi:TPP-dependent indolepyruvate ferredoxin oxidoreductase alpha subunit